MSRIVKEYDERRTEFLDVAQELFYSKGYEQTSVQEIIRRVGVAKGTFYHYFASKSELLDALVERMLTETMAMVEPIIADENLNAIQKFENYFARVNSWKAANRDYVLEIARALYHDENVLLRTRLRSYGQTVISERFARVIQQGISEGLFDVSEPEHTAQIILAMGQACADSMIEQLLTDSPDAVVVDQFKAMIAAYERSMERVLGAPIGSLCVIPLDVLAIWFPENV